MTCSDKSNETPGPNFDIKDNFDVDKTKLDNDDEENDHHDGHQAQLQHQR